MENLQDKITMTFKPFKKPILVRREGKDIIITCSDELQAIEIFNAINTHLRIQQKKEDEVTGIFRGFYT